MSNDSALTDHAYDGIQEFDNPLPGWWKWMFVGSIVFSVFYAMYFHIGAPGRTISGPVRQPKYRRLLKSNLPGDWRIEADGQRHHAVRQGPGGRQGQLAEGRSNDRFKANCVSCHGRDGEGKVGPNLTDDAYFKNVRKDRRHWQSVDQRGW
jgi:cytochrome c oxidase cbb3-type subunit 3